MRELVETIVKGIVENEGAVKTDMETVDDREIVKLSVAADDMGKVIGKGGKVIRAIRNLLRVKASIQRKRAYLELLNPQQDG
jgi:predicted RNA-binding protein YlqC (UPF0109 family)